MRLARILLLCNLLLPCAATASAADKSWQGQALDDLWGSALNWSPNGSPAVGENVFIGDVAQAENQSTQLDSDYQIAALALSNGSDVATSGFLLDIDGQLSLGNPGTAMVVNQHLGGDGTTALDVHGVDISAGGLFRTEGARTVVAGTETSPGALNIATGGTYAGWGTLHFGDALGGVLTTQLSNDGTFQAARDGSAPDVERFTLTIESSDLAGDAQVDLDGATNGGNVAIDLNTTLDIDVQLADFHGTMNFAPGAVLDLLHSELLQGSAMVNVAAATSTPGVESTATIRGGNISTNGSTQINVQSGTLIFDSRLEAGTDADINLADGTSLIFNGSAQLDGDLNTDANNVTLTVNSNVIINDDSWDWDGLSGGPSITIINSAGLLAINSDAIETSSDGQMDGTIELNGGALDANVTGGWKFDGNLTVDSTHATSIISGTMMTAGDATIFVGSGDFHTQVDASVAFTSDAATEVEGELVLGDSQLGHNITFQGGSSHTGSGMLGVGGNIAILGATLIDMPSGVVQLQRSGEDVSQTMDVNANLVVTAQSFGELGSAAGAGSFTININNGSSVMFIDVLGPQDAWTLGANGTLNINSDSTLNNSLRGDDINIQGRVNIDGETRFTARIHLQSGGVIDLPQATDLLQLAGAAGVGVNQLSGGTIDGSGKLTTANSADLEGHGIINANVEFRTSSELWASDGTLILNGQVKSTGVLGVKNGGTLQLGQPLDTSGVTRVDLEGGEIIGAGIENNTAVRGRGSISVTSFSNNGILFGLGSPGETLVVSATLGIDLDGTGVSGEVQASSGDITIASSLTDAFGGRASVFAERTLAFEQGWALDTTGTLAFTGDLVNHAIVDSSATALRGTVNVSGQGRFAGNTTFEPDVIVNLTNSIDRLEILGVSVVQSGATFTGAGVLSNLAAAQLILADGADLDVSLINAGVLELDRTANVATFEQLASGVLLVDISSSAENQYDQLVFDNGANIAGALQVTVSPDYTPLVGHQFEILTGSGGVTGVFDSLAGDLPALSIGLTWEIDYTPAAVILRVVEGGVAGDFNDDGLVNLADYTVWRDNLGASDETAINNNGDGGGITADDYTIWKTHFGQGSTELAAESRVVPEASTIALFAMALIVGLSLRRSAS